MARSVERLASYEQRVAKPLLVLSVIYLALVFVEIMPDVRVGPLITFLDGVMWTVFAADYFYRLLFLAPDPVRYARRPLCILDAVVVLSFPVLLVVGSGVFGLARIGRLIVQVTRVARVGAQGGRAIGHAHSVFRRRSLRFLLPIAVGIVLLAALLVWRYETAENTATIQSLPDALWWSISTLITGGYGDVFPKTPEGKGASVVVMLVGVMLIGWVTASLASMFVEADDHGMEEREQLRHQLAEISERLAHMEELLVDSKERDILEEQQEVRT